MTSVHPSPVCVGLSVAIAVMCLMTTGQAVELNPAAVVYKMPEQFQWRDPTDQAATNRTVLHGDPSKRGLYIYINKFKPNRFGNPHYHPNDRFITGHDGRRLIQHFRETDQFGRMG